MRRFGVSNEHALNEGFIPNANTFAPPPLCLYIFSTHIVYHMSHVA